MSQNSSSTTHSGKRAIVAFLGGIIFAFGLGISGMSDPKKILGFLNVLGKWDPQLIFVMIGALAVHIPANLYMKKKHSPVLDVKMHLPHQTSISRELMIGSAIFGVGWALSGFCPGPGLVASMDGNWSAITFVIAMVVGMAIHHFYQQMIYKEE